MTMEDKGLTVRMEVGESMVRSMLERDLQQLKNSLAESGINVERFDIRSEGDRSQRENGQSKTGGRLGAGGEEADGESAEETDGEPRGPVKLASPQGGVDYLVY